MFNIFFLPNNGSELSGYEHISEYDIWCYQKLSNEELGDELNICITTAIAREPMIYNKNHRKKTGKPKK